MQHAFGKLDKAKENQPEDDEGENIHRDRRGEHAAGMFLSHDVPPMLVSSPNR